MADDHSRGESIGRNSAFSLLALLVGATFTAGLTVFLVRRLGTAGFGTFSLALGIAGLTLLPSDFGLSASAARFVAEHRGDHARVASVLADSLRVKLLISAAVAAALIALAGPIASAYGTPALTWPLRGVSIALFGQSLMMMTSTFAAIARVRFQLWTAIVESFVEMTASIGLVLAGAGVAGAAFGRAIGYLAGGGVTVLVLARLFGREAVPRSLRFGMDARRIATYGSVLLIIDSAYTLFNQIDILVIGAYLGTSAVGIFSAPLRLVVFLAYPGGAISAGVSPLLARKPGQEPNVAGREPNVAAFSAALRVLLILEAAITAFVLGWAPLLVHVVLGAKYAKSAAVLRALAPFVFLLGFGSLVSGTANYLGEARRRVPIAITTVIVNFLLDLALVPRIGVIGGCIATDVAYALYAPGHLAICQRALRLDLRPLAITLLRTLTAGGALLGTLLIVGAPLGQPWRVLLGGLTGTAAFAFVLWATKEVRANEALALLGRLPVLNSLLRVRPNPR
jgi:O-antigen/teichoic acid export membrane protein